MFQVGSSKNAKNRYIVARQLETQFKRNSNIELKKHQSGGKKAGKGQGLFKQHQIPSCSWARRRPSTVRLHLFSFWEVGKAMNGHYFFERHFLLYCGDRGQTVAKLREELRRQTREKTGKLDSKSTKRSKAPRSKKSAQQLYDHNLLNSSVIWTRIEWRRCKERQVKWTALQVQVKGQKKQVQVQ